MLDKNNPLDVKKAIQRAQELAQLMADLRLIMELIKPGNGELIVKSMLMGGCIGMNDDDWNTWIAGVHTLVNGSLDIIMEATNKPRPDTEEVADPAKLHKIDKGDMN